MDLLWRACWNCDAKLGVTLSIWWINLLPNMSSEYFIVWSHMISVSQEIGYFLNVHIFPPVPAFPLTNGEFSWQEFKSLTCSSSPFINKYFNIKIFRFIFSAELKTEVSKYSVSQLPFEEISSLYRFLQNFKTKFKASSSYYIAEFRVNPSFAHISGNQLNSKDNRTHRL